MKISLNWLKKYVQVPVSDEELIRLIGARLVEVEGVIDETHKYDNIYIVRVESCEKIPDTHLTLCQIDPGSEVFERYHLGHAQDRSAEPTVLDDTDSKTSNCIQVVCGAPNVREGMLAVWIAPGAVVPASVHEDAPFVIGKRKMRGYESCGMLAGADELGFGDDHSGIVEIEPGTAEPGDLLADVFGLNDLVLEIENKSLTHRPDCFGVIGFAREVAGILGEQGLSDMSFLEPTFSPSTSYAGAPAEPPLRANLSGPSGIYVSGLENREMFSIKTLSDTRSLAISILDPSICQRYSAVVMEKHGELKPKYLTWVDTILSKSGMKPISPIVDATNYLMLLTGQPLHAFDYDKFVAVGGGEELEINVRLARAGEKLVLLDDTEVVLNENDIVICSGEVPVALAGAMGGKSTMIDENTRNIIIESATFSLYNLRKTQMVHGIFSEAITRFTKGQPPYQTLAVAERCAKMLADGFKVTAVADEYPRPEREIMVRVTTGEINCLLGTEYDDGLIRRTLENVGFEVKGSKGNFEVGVPEWRTDIHIKEDVIEEVGRLLGYDNIKPVLPLHGTASINKMWELKKWVRGTMAKYGANEVLTYSFVSGRLLEKVGQEAENSYRIVNSISPELQYVRQSLVPSLLEKAYMNEKLPVEKFAIFEMNKVYQKEWGVDSGKVPVEKMSLGCVVAERKGKGTAFYKVKKYAAKLLEELNITAKFLPMDGEAAAGTVEGTGAEAKPFEPVRTARILVNGEYIGVVGELRNSVRNEFKLAPYAAGFEVDLGKVLEFASAKKEIRFGERKTEDLTVTTDRSYAETLAEVQAQYPEAKITPGTIYQAPGQKTRNLTFHIENGQK